MKAFRSLGALRTYFLEVSRPRLGTYRRKAPNSAYQYEALHNPSQEIRLIKLTKTPFGVTCTLKCFPLHEAPTYEAISYTWGSSYMDHLVFFNGHWLPTTQNVYKILQDRASYFHIRWVWIDAVCINQNDDVEKSIQVSLMGEIYHSAERVIIWLGDIAVTRVEVVGIFLLLSELDYYIQNYVHYKERIESMELKIGRHWEWYSFCRLMNHPYWERTWIIQEVVKARKVYVLYGGRHISWGILSAAVNQLLCRPGMEIKGHTGNFGSGILMDSIIQVGNILNIRDAIAGADGKLLSFELAMNLTRSCVVTDPRDKIFALSNLIQIDAIEGNADIRPNYRLSVQEVYTRTAHYLLSQGSCYGLLHSGIGHKRNIPALPSWVPDWTAIGSYFLPVSSVFACSYRSSGNSVFYLHIRIRPITKKPAEISFRHIIPLSRIKYVSAIALRTNSTAGKKDFCDGVMAFYRSARLTAFENLPATYSLTKQSLNEAFWRTLIGDVGLVNAEIQEQRPAEDRYGRYFVVWEKQFLEGLEGLGWNDNKEVLSYAKVMIAACCNRKLAVTEDGMIALVPPYTEIGDLICLVGGMPMPVLLRGEGRERGGGGGEKSEEERWRMVGSCYVHGIMDGELWDGGKGAREFKIY